MKLAGYIRVSTEGQVDAFGKTVQRDSIRRWALLNGHEITDWYEEDAVSGTKDSGDRPELSALVRDAETLEIEGIVAFDPTRIARRLFVQETLLNLIWGRGLKVFTTTAGEIAADEDDPTRILIRQVLGVLAEFEHRTIVRRLNAGRKAKSNEGGYIGGTPRYGLSIVGSGKAAQFVMDDVESEVIEEIKYMHGLGESLRTIANRLNARGIPTKTGGAWHASQVSRIIKRSLNA